MVIMPVWVLVLYGLVGLFALVMYLRQRYTSTDIEWRFGSQGRHSQQLRPDATVYEWAARPNKCTEILVPISALLLDSLLVSMCPDCSKNVLSLTEAEPAAEGSQKARCPDCGQKYNWCPGFFAERI